MVDREEMNRHDATGARREEPGEEVDALARTVIEAAVEVHRVLGPGFLESIDEQALAVDRTTIGPFVSARGGISEGRVHETEVQTLNATGFASVFPNPTISTEGPATLFASGLVGARVAFAGL